MTCNCCQGLYAEGDPVVNLAGQDSTITICKDGTYCCGIGAIANSCCEKQQGVYLLSNGEVSRNNPSVTASKPLTSATSPPNPSPPPTAPNSSSRNIRIIIGTIFGTLSLILMVVILILVRQVRKLQKANQSQAQVLVEKDMASARKEMDGVQRKELPGSTFIPELHGHSSI